MIAEPRIAEPVRPVQEPTVFRSRDILYKGTSVTVIACGWTAGRVVRTCFPGSPDLRYLRRTRHVPRDQFFTDSPSESGPQHRSKVHYGARRRSLTAARADRAAPPTPSRTTRPSPVRSIDTISRPCSARSERLATSACRAVSHRDPERCRAGHDFRTRTHRTAARPHQAAALACRTGPPGVRISRARNENPTRGF